MLLFRAFAVMLAFVCAASGGPAARATDIYLIQLRGLLPDRAWTRTPSTVLTGRYLGYGHRTIAGEGGIVVFRFLVDGERWPRSIAFALPLAYSADGFRFAVECSSHPMKPATIHACNADPDEGALTGSAHVRVVAQDVSVPGELQPVTITQDVCVLQSEHRAATVQRQDACDGGLPPT